MEKLLCGIINGDHSHITIGTHGGLASTLVEIGRGSSMVVFALPKGVYDTMHYLLKRNIDTQTLKQVDSISED